jgi:hypothetical protein
LITTLNFAPRFQIGLGRLLRPLGRSSARSTSSQDFARVDELKKKRRAMEENHASLPRKKSKVSELERKDSSQESDDEFLPDWTKKDDEKLKAPYQNGAGFSQIAKVILKGRHSASDCRHRYNNVSVCMVLTCQFSQALNPFHEIRQKI